MTGVGFSSITSVVKLLRERIAKDGRPCRIFYISDFDPAGQEIPRSTSRQIEFWLDKYALNGDVTVNHIMLTKEQVEHYRLPRIPVKESDRRKKKFEERNGEGQVELDALEALHPGEFARIVTEAILQFRDLTFADTLSDTREEIEDTLTEKWEKRVEPYGKELEELREGVTEIAKEYQEKLKALSKDMDKALAPYRKRREVLWLAIHTEATVLQGQIDLPELPKPDVEPDEDGWLFDSQRDYLEQLSYYKAHKNGTDEAPSPADEEDEAA